MEHGDDRLPARRQQSPRGAVALLLLLTACTAGTPGARIVPSPVDTDDGAVDVTVRFPATVTRGSTVEVMVTIAGRDGIATYDEAGIDVALNARGLWNVQVTPIGGEVTSGGFTGLVGGIQGARKALRTGQPPRLHSAFRCCRRCTDR